MIALIDWILNLFHSEDAARAFVAAPEQAMRDAGLSGVTAAQLSSVAATALPGLVLGGGDPLVGLQRAVANEYGIEPTYQPSLDALWAPNYAPAPSFAPQTQTELASRNNAELASNNDTALASNNDTALEWASRNNTDLASHNDTSLLSPPQNAGANAQQGAFNLGLGDITLGDKTSNSASGHGVVVGADSNGDIVSGDSSVLGTDNAVTNGDIRSDHGSNISTGQAAVIRDSGSTTTAGADAITTADSGTVIKGSDNGGVNNGTSIGGGQTTTTVGGTGNSAATDGHESTTTVTEVTHTTTTTTDNSDNSVHETAVTDTSTHDSSSHSLFDVSSDTSLLNSALDGSHDLALASGNHLLGF